MAIICEDGLGAGKLNISCIIVPNGLYFLPLLNHCDLGFNNRLRAALSRTNSGELKATTSQCFTYSLFLVQFSDKNTES